MADDDDPAQTPTTGAESGAGRPTSGPHSSGHSPGGPSEEMPGRFKRDPVGGEGEGEPAIAPEEPAGPPRD